MTLAERCRKIEALVLDVDGTLTAGGIAYADPQAELKTFHVHDGAGLKLWRQAGKQAAIITGRRSPIVEARAAELGIAHVVQGAADKRPGLRTVLDALRLEPEQMCVVGDDLPDLPLIRSCGLGVAVADGCPEMRRIAHYVTRNPGGHGAVREVVELILRCQGRWPRFEDPSESQ